MFCMFNMLCFDVGKIFFHKYFRVLQGMLKPWRLRGGRALLSKCIFDNKNNIKTNFDTIASSMAKFVTEKVDNSFLEMRLIEPGDYYKDYFLLLADLSDIDPTKITLQQFSSKLDKGAKLGVK